MKKPRILSKIIDAASNYLREPSDHVSSARYSEVLRIMQASGAMGDLVAIPSVPDNCESCVFRKKCASLTTRNALYNLAVRFNGDAELPNTAQIEALHNAHLTVESLQGEDPLPDESVVTLQRGLDACGAQVWQAYEVPRVFEAPLYVDAALSVGSKVVEIERITS